MTVSLEFANLLIKCPRPDLGTHYVQIIVKTKQMDIDYLRLEGPRLVSQCRESLLYKDYPEAQQIHDGQGWDFNELSAWVSLFKAVTRSDLMETNRS